MSKSEYTLVLPAFTIGIHAYDAIGKITKHFGKKVVIIGGKTALSKAKQPLLDAIAKRISKSSMSCGTAMMLPLNTSTAC